MSRARLARTICRTLPRKACVQSSATVLTASGGFILGGLVTHGAEPGLGIILLPVGALFLLFALFKLARGVR